MTAPIPERHPDRSTRTEEAMSLTEDALEQVGRLFKENAELRTELARVRAELAARIAAESADAAAGSYAGRAEEAEAAVATLHAVVENMHKHDREQREGRRQAETALARLRAQLGKTRIEWGVQHPLYGTDYIQGVDNARTKCDQLNADEVDQPWRVVTRLAGQWRGEDEPDATRLERYDATPRTALERAADEQDDREQLLRENPELIEQIQEGIAEAEAGQTVYLGSFAQYLDDEADEQGDGEGGGA